MPRIWQEQEPWVSMCQSPTFKGPGKLPEGRKGALSEEGREGKGQRFKPVPRSRQGGTWRPGVARQLKAEMETSVEPMVLEPGRLALAGLRT